MKKKTKRKSKQKRHKFKRNFQWFGEYLPDCGGTGGQYDSTCGIDPDADFIDSYVMQYNIIQSQSNIIFIKF